MNESKMLKKRINEMEERKPETVQRKEASKKKN